MNVGTLVEAAGEHAELLGSPSHTDRADRCARPPNERLRRWSRARGMHASRAVRRV